MSRPYRNAVPRSYPTLARWAHKLTSSLMELRTVPDQDTAPVQCGLTYLLRHWPSLPDTSKTADVYRTLSMMSHRRVNRAWILRTSRLTPRQVDGLLQCLVQQDAVEIVDIALFARDIARAK